MLKFYVPSRLLSSKSASFIVHTKKPLFQVTPLTRSKLAQYNEDYEY
ncbi:hypothetical protein [Paenibacillus peoriae]|nr:hypothetical protein [Paenibacillus peoriae]